MCFCTSSSLVLVSVGNLFSDPQEVMACFDMLALWVFFIVSTGSRIHLLRWWFWVWVSPKERVCWPRNRATATPPFQIPDGRYVTGCLGSIALSRKCTKCKPSQRGDHGARAGRHSYLLCRRLDGGGCLTPIFIRTREEPSILNLFCKMVPAVCPVNVCSRRFMIFFLRVRVIVLISDINNCLVDRCKDKNTGGIHWIWGASVNRSMTLSFLSN